MTSCLLLSDASFNQINFHKNTLRKSFSHFHELQSFIEIQQQISLMFFLDLLFNSAVG